MASSKKQFIGVGILLIVLILLGLGAAWLVTRTKPSETPKVFYPEGYVPPQPGQYPVSPGETLEKRLEALEAAPTIRFLSIPQRVAAQQPFSVRFLVSVPSLEQPAKAQRATVHFGPISFGYLAPGELNEDSYPQEIAVAPEEEEISLPRAFSASITPSQEFAGTTLYMRAHVIIEGQDYWSGEISITVTP